MMNMRHILHDYCTYYDYVWQVSFRVRDLIRLIASFETVYYKLKRNTYSLSYNLWKVSDTFYIVVARTMIMSHKEVYVRKVVGQVLVAHKYHYIYVRQVLAAHKYPYLTLFEFHFYLKFLLFLMIFF